MAWKCGRWVAVARGGWRLAGWSERRFVRPGLSSAWWGRAQKRGRAGRQAHDARMYINSSWFGPERPSIYYNNYLLNVVNILCPPAHSKLAQHINRLAAEHQKCIFQDVELIGSAEQSFSGGRVINASLLKETAAAELICWREKELLDIFPS